MNNIVHATRRTAASFESPLLARAVVVALLAFAGLTAPESARAQGNSSRSRVAAITPPSNAVLKFSPAMTSAQLRALPADTLIELHSGRKVTAARLAATTDALKSIGTRQRNLRSMDLQMSRTNAAPQMQWAGPQQLQEVSRLPGNTVVELKNGQRLSVSDINKLQELSARTGLRQKLEARANARGASLGGTPALVIRSAADLRQVERLPDQAIVASEDGKRTTAGDIRRVMAQRAGQSSSSPRIPGTRR